MTNEEVQLFGYWASPFSKRVEIALRMKGINYKYIHEDLSNKSPELLKYNPVHKKVPVLLHNGKSICESLVILEYIDETWKSGPSILPKDPYDKFVARFWSRFIDDKYIPAIYKAAGSQGEEQKKAIKEAAEHLKTLEKQLKGNKFFGGEDIGIVDIAATTIALWLVVLQDFLETKVLTKEKFPRLCEWIEDYLSCSVIKQTLPSADDLAMYFTAAYSSAN